MAPSKLQSSPKLSYWSTPTFNQKSLATDCQIALYHKTATKENICTHEKT